MTTHPAGARATTARTSPARTGRWHDVARATGLLGPDGTPRPTIFTEMSALAARTGAINLGQGFPDVDGPESVKQVAAEAIAAGVNQYPPGPGIPELRRAVVAHQERHYGLTSDPDTEVLVTTGATEALAATVLALTEPGDEVLTLEPFYDSYAAVIALAGARHTTAPLVATPDGFRLDVRALRAAVTDRTRIILLNTPHNPTGAVLTPAELADLLTDGLTAAGFDVVRPQGTYFVVADAARLLDGPLAGLGLRDAADLCRRLPELAGVVGVPVQAFTHDGSAAGTALRTAIRFTFVKQESVLREAADRLAALGTGRP